MNKIIKVVLENGLTIYLYSDKRRHSTFFQFVNLCGGITKDFVVDGKEYHMQDGLAHILEHYVVECNSKGNFLKILGEKQMNTNASTHINMTDFYFETVENVNFGINTMLNGIYNVNFNEENLEKLKNPIYQEIRGKSDSKFYQLNRLCNDNLFKNIKFRDIGGTLEEVKNTTVEDLKIFYEAFYQPSNQFIVIAGNFNKKEVLDEIYKFYENLDFQKHEVKVLKEKESLEVNKKEDILYYKTPLEYVNITFKFDVSKYTPKEMLTLDYYIHSFFNSFFGTTSPLYDKLTKSKVITSGIGCGSIRLNNTLTISIGSYTYDVDVFKKEVLDTIQNMNDFDEEKFELDKKQSIVSMILRDENIFKTILPFVDNVVDFNYPYVDTIEDIEDFNFDDYVNMIKKLDFSNYSINIIVDPENKKNTI